MARGGHPHRDDAVVVGVTVRAARQVVWARLVEPERWWPGMRLTARLGAAFEETWDGGVTRGRVEEVVEDSLLRLSWADDDWRATTEVVIALADVELGTTIVVIHTGWSALDGSAELIPAHQAGWRHHLDALRSLIDGDTD